MTEAERLMLERATAAIERIADAATRLADRFAPQGELHKPRPAEIRTATYTREGRELKEWKERAKEQEKRAPEPARR